MYRRFVSPFFSLCCLACTVFAAEVRADLVVGSTPGVRHEIDGIANFGGNSASMVGLEVMVHFSDGSSDLGIWTPTGISQNNWTITQGANPFQSTFTFPFELTNNTGLDITRFTLSGAGSSTFFDRSLLPGTPGSGRGRDLQEFTSLRFSQDITATYFDEIEVVGQAPQGDLFAGLDVAFSAGIAANGGTFSFRTDTDNAINLVRSTIPEPTSVLQFGILFCGLMARRRRKTHSSN